MNRLFNDHHEASSWRAFHCARVKRLDFFEVQATVGEQSAGVPAFQLQRAEIHREAESFVSAVDACHIPCVCLSSCHHHMVCRIAGEQFSVVPCSRHRAEEVAYLLVFFLQEALGPISCASVGMCGC